MTIEQQCNKMIQQNCGTLMIEDCLWDGIPYSLRIEIYGKDSLEYEVDKLIKKADLTECLTSKSEYIREYKKWYMGMI